MSLRTLLITQTIVGLLGLLPAYFIGIASVMSAANAQNHLKLASFVIVVALALPFVLGLSLIAMWVAHSWGSPRVATAFVILPWAHLALLIAATLGLFRS
ncbi:MAG: hypothetical protein JWO94_2838 [Verrucomicrobiaceae bacterium]|nr:hypothetical protein [Verrucomicrobiaceae bacterium]